MQMEQLKSGPVRLVSLLNSWDLPVLFGLVPCGWLLAQVAGGPSNSALLYCMPHVQVVSFFLSLSASHRTHCQCPPEVGSWVML